MDTFPQKPAGYAANVIKTGVLRALVPGKDFSLSPLGFPRNFHAIAKTSKRQNRRLKPKIQILSSYYVTKTIDTDLQIRCARFVASESGIDFQRGTFVDGHLRQAFGMSPSDTYVSCDTCSEEAVDDSEAPSRWRPEDHSSQWRTRLPGTRRLSSAQDHPQRHSKFNNMPETVDQRTRSEPFDRNLNARLSQFTEQPLRGRIMLRRTTSS